MSQPLLPRDADQTYEAIHQKIAELHKLIRGSTKCKLSKIECSRKFIPRLLKMLKHSMIE
jgi:hypothetical protein